MGYFWTNVPPLATVLHRVASTAEGEIKQDEIESSGSLLVDVGISENPEALVHRN